MAKHRRGKQLGNDLGQPADEWIEDEWLESKSGCAGFQRIRDAVEENRGIPVLFHLIDLAHFYEFDPGDPEVIARAVRAARRSAAQGHLLAERRQLLGRVHDPLVYYMRHGNRIKIGTSTNIRARLETFQPEELAAVERGGHQVERARHRTFADLRTAGEWFRAEPPLAQFVAVLASNFEREFGEPMEQWLKRHAGPLDQV